MTFWTRGLHLAATGACLTTTAVNSAMDSPARSLIPGDGEMARRIRDFDWSQSPLGSIDTWPQSLRIALGICITSRFPMFLWWGPALINFYNDAYIAILGKRHPDALGRPAAEIWREVWNVIGPEIDAVLTRGESSWQHRTPLTVERNGYPEEAIFTWSHSPVVGDDGAIAGVLCVVAEETAAVRAEETLRDAEERYRAVFESSRDANIIYTLDGTVVDANPAACQIYGVTREMMVGLHAPSVIHPDARPLFQEFLKICGAGGVHHCETVDRRMDGSAFPIEVLGTSLKYNGRLHVMAVIRDISDRKRAEDAIRASERQMRMLTDVLPALIGYLGRDLCYQFNNRCYDEWFGRSHEALRGTHMRDLLGEEIYQQRLPYALKALAGETVRFSGVTNHRQHGPRECEIVYVSDRGEDGEVRGFVVLVQDITERLRAERELRHSEERFAAFMNNSPTASWITDTDGRIEYLSETYVRTFRLPTENPIGKRPTDLYPPEFARKYIENIRTVAESDRVLECVENAPRPDGSIGEFLVYKFPLRDGSGRTVVGGVAIDVTERRRAQRDREKLLLAERAARAEAEHASHMKDEFLATLSHELRTPLTAILGWSQILRNEHLAEVHLEQGLEVIERNARSQTRIIEDLLDMSRIIAGKLRLDVKPIALPPVIEAAIETVRPAAQAKGVRLVVSLGVPAAPITGDPNRLQQVFWNLLSNSVKHTQRGGQVQVMLQQEAGHLQVTVTDDGEGISPDFLPHVFDRFRQADASTTRRHGGLGLGLSIAKQLIELHGGTVRADSAGVGQGATFTVTLPLMPPEQEPQPAAVGASTGKTAANAETSPRRDSGDGLTNVHVLYVDDEPDARELVQRILGDVGARVTTAGSAAEAIEVLRHHRPDVLVSDIGLPVEDGYALIRQVRAARREEGGRIPALALTAYARTEDRMRAIESGFNDHMIKPLEPEELIATVRELAGRR